MIKYICDFCKKEIENKQEVRTLAWLVDKTKKTIHLHKSCLLDYTKDISEDVEDTKEETTKTVSEEVNVTEKKEVVLDVDLSTPKTPPIPVSAYYPEEEKQSEDLLKADKNDEPEKSKSDDFDDVIEESQVNLTEDSYDSKILKGTATYDKAPIEYKPSKRYKGLFTEVQCVILSKYIHGTINVGLKHTGLNYTQAYNWVTKFENKELIEVFKHEKITEVIDDKSYDVKVICNLFVSGKKIDWIAYDKSYDKDIVKRIIDKYSGVVLIEK